MMEENRDPRSLLTQLNARRAECHRKVDEQINAELCRLALGDEAQNFLNGPGELLPFSVPPAVFKGRKPSAIILRGKETSVSTWKQAAVLILRDCDAIPECHDRLLGLRGHVLARYRTLLAEAPDEMDAPMKISDGLYWEGRQDVEAMMRALMEQVLVPAGYEYWRIVIRCQSLEQENASAEKQARDSQLLPLTAPPGSFRGKKPAFVILHGEEFAAPTWKQVAAVILRDCCSDPQRRRQMMKLRGLYDGPRRALLAETPKGMLSPIRVGRDLYFEGHWDSESMMRLLVERILVEVGYDCQSAAVKCRNVKQGSIVMTEGTQSKAISEGLADEAQQAADQEQRAQDGSSGIIGPFM